MLMKLRPISVANNKMLYYYYSIITNMILHLYFKLFQTYEKVLWYKPKYQFMKSRAVITPQTSIFKPKITEYRMLHNKFSNDLFLSTRFELLEIT